MPKMSLRQFFIVCKTAGVLFTTLGCLLLLSGSNALAQLSQGIAMCGVHMGTTELWMVLGEGDFAFKIPGTC